LVEALLSPDGAAAVAHAASGQRMVAPDLINPEALSALRRLERAGTLSRARAGQAVADLADAPVRRVLTVGLIEAAWAVRANLSAYDACYVALARALDCGLVTADARLGAAPRLGIPVTVV
jgi:predicted nucleic acid-binding protein